MKVKELRNRDIISIEVESQIVYSGIGVVAPSYKERTTLKTTNSCMWEVFQALEMGLNMDKVLYALTSIELHHNHKKGGMVCYHTFHVKCMHPMDDHIEHYKIKISEFTSETTIETSYYEEETPMKKEIKPFSVIAVMALDEEVSNADPEIQKYIDSRIKSHVQAQHEEAEKYFGKNYWGLTISRCSEPEFKNWWEINKEIPYDSYYYEVAQFVWDKYSEYITP